MRSQPFINPGEPSAERYFQEWFWRRDRTNSKIEANEEVTIFREQIEQSAEHQYQTEGSFPFTCVNRRCPEKAKKHTSMPQDTPF